MPNDDKGDKGEKYGQYQWQRLCVDGLIADQERVYRRNQISYADDVQSRLHGLGVCEDSPLAKVPQTYLARFFILDDVF